MAIFKTGKIQEQLMYDQQAYTPELQGTAEPLPAATAEQGFAYRSTEPDFLNYGEAVLTYNKYANNSGKLAQLTPEEAHELKWATEVIDRSEKEKGPINKFLRDALGGPLLYSATVLQDFADHPFTTMALGAISFGVGGAAMMGTRMLGAGVARFLPNIGGAISKGGIVSGVVGKGATSHYLESRRQLSEHKKAGVETEEPPTAIESIEYAIRNLPEAFFLPMAFKGAGMIRKHAVGRMKSRTATGGTTQTGTTQTKNDFYKATRDRVNIVNTLIKNTMRNSWNGRARPNRVNSATRSNYQQADSAAQDIGLFSRADGIKNDWVSSKFDFATFEGDSASLGAHLREFYDKFVDIDSDVIKSRDIDINIRAEFEQFFGRYHAKAKAATSETAKEMKELYALHRLGKKAKMPETPEETTNRIRARKDFYVKAEEFIQKYPDKEESEELRRLLKTVLEGGTL